MVWPQDVLLGLDLGTANTVMVQKGVGVILREPSIIAMNKTNRRIVSVGYDAKDLLGKVPDDLMTVRPLRDGVITDFLVAEAMIRLFLKRIERQWWQRKPKLLIGVPHGCTQVEKKAVSMAAKEAGARHCITVDEPFAAAVGAGLSVASEKGVCVIDIGGGTTEMAIIALNGIVVGHSLRVAGDAFDTAIIEYCKKQLNLLVGEQEAERIKCEIGIAIQEEDPKSCTITGRDVLTGMPRASQIASDELLTVFEPLLMKMIEHLKCLLEKTPPELSRDLLETGLVITGGGALMRGIDVFFKKYSLLPVRIASDPLTCVALGTGILIQQKSYWK